MAVSFLKAIVYVIAFIVSMYAVNGLNFEKIMRSGHAGEIQILYWLLAMGIAYLAGSFILAIIQI